MSGDPTAAAEAAPLQLPTTVAGPQARQRSLRARRLSLVLCNTSHAGARFVLGERPLRLGKSPECELVVDDPMVSRVHASVGWHGERVLVRDLGSTNGTWLDDAEVREGYLRIGGKLQVGEVVLRLEADEAAVELPPRVSGRWGELVGESVQMRQLFAMLERVGSTESGVLVEGETGTGKDAVLRQLHAVSPRRAGPLVVLDCAAVCSSLVESELFGHERGAFTGAETRRAGLFERADGGTLVLDELDDLPLTLQPKLLRALEERRYERLGSNRSRTFDARVLAASKRSLWDLVQQGRFRQDLFFRIAVFTVVLPPLRERREDLPALVDALAGEPLWARLPEVTREELLAHPWPGNVRELRNAVERLRLPQADGAEEPPLGVPPSTAPQADVLPVRYGGRFRERKEEVVRAFEREYLTRLLADAEWNITEAARRGDVDRKHLYELMAKHQLTAPLAKGRRR